MCSIEPRLGGGETSSRFTMIDSSQQGSSGLATALRDRSSCTIPNQPNRSLPVRPAPHTPCRSILPRRSLQTHTLQSTATVESSESAHATVTTSTEQKLHHPTLGVITIGVPNWQNDIRQPYINIISLPNPPDKLAEVRAAKRKAEADDSVSTSNCSLIDISGSPDRSDCSKLDSPSSNSASDSSKPINLDLDSGALKKKRRRKLKRDDEKIEINLEPSPSKIVPPLRLKKIQSLQEDVSSCASTWGTLQKPEEAPEVMPGFRFYQPQPQEPEVIEDSSKYRIVTGTTPPYDECIDSSTVQQLGHRPEDVKNEQKDEKLRFRQNKLKLKLRELKRKTVELGREMLRTALTSPDKSVQETIDSYEEQIEKLTSLLKKLPEAAAKVDADCQLEDILPGSMVSSTMQTSGISLISAASSPEPPKLSPKTPVDFATVLSSSEIRDSPPVLSKATVIHGDDTEDTWREFEGLRGLLKISRKGKQRQNLEKSAVASSVITTTSESSIHEEIDLDSKSEILDLGLSEVTKSEVNTENLGNEIKAIEIRSLAASEVQEVMKIDLRGTPSPGEMIIDTTSVLQEFEQRAEPADVTIADSVTLEENLNIQQPQENTLRIQTPAPIISSSCERPKQPATLEECLSATPTKELIIGDQFPSLGNWLARMSAKIPNEAPRGSAEAKKPTDQIVIESRTPAFQGNIQVYTQSGGKTSVVDLTTSGGGITETRRDWRDERWPSQEQRLQPASQTYVNGTVPMGGVQVAQQQQQQQGQQMGQEYCPPAVSLSRYYPRNYPMDPYSLPYGYNHPAIAAATAASLWGGALLQYPFLRPRGLPQSYQPRLPSNLMQYNLPPGSMSQQRPPPPPYPLSGPSQVAQNSKRSQSILDNVRTNTVNYDPIAISKRNEYPPISMHQATVSSRDQFGRVYTDPGVRPSVQEASRDQLNYRQSWRTSMLPPGPLAPRNYPINSNWAADPCSLLSALSPVALQNYSGSMQMVQRDRNAKEPVDQTRNCETPHLGKVNYSPNTARTLECSNCSSPGPLFKCLGCEVAFYCDETCQIRHWNRHVVSCPKKMPKLKKVVP